MMLCVYTNCYSSPLLAGVPCRDVTVEDSNVVKCVTGPQPSRSTYYPGMNIARKEWVIECTSYIATCVCVKGVVGGLSCKIVS